MTLPLISFIELNGVLHWVLKKITEQVF